MPWVSSTVGPSLIFSDPNVTNILRITTIDNSVLALRNSRIRYRESCRYFFARKGWVHRAPNPSIMISVVSKSSSPCTFSVQNASSLEYYWHILSTNSADFSPSLSAKFISPTRQAWIFVIIVGPVRKRSCPMLLPDDSSAATCLPPVYYHSFK